MKTTLEAYRESRDVLLNKITDALPREGEYTPGSISFFQSAREERLAALRELCNQKPILKGQVMQFPGVEPATPIAEFEKLFLLAHDAIYQA